MPAFASDNYYLHKLYRLFQGAGETGDPAAAQVSLTSGDNNVGNVDVASIAAGDNNIGNVDIASIAAGNNNIGDVDIASIAAGDNNIGNVDVASMPTVANSIKISPVGGSKTVAATGTAEALVAIATNAKMLYVRAKITNTGNVYFGNSTVDKTTSQQVILAAGQSVSVNAETGYRLDVNEFYIDVDVNSEGVDYLYIA